jgi:hypothetical protein
MVGSLMAMLQRLWQRLRAAFVRHDVPRSDDWVMPGNAVANAILADEAAELLMLPGRRQTPRVSLDDYPALQEALRDLAADRIRDRPEVTPTAPPVTATPQQPARPAAERRSTTVSTRSARRRKSRHAA